MWLVRSLPLPRSIDNLPLKVVYYRRFDRWRRAHPCPSTGGERYQDRYRFYEAILGGGHLNEPVDYLEFGVFKGASIRWWSEHLRSPESRFVGFDSFEGLPETVSQEWHAGRFSTGGATPAIDDARVSFRAGWFHRSLPTFLRTFERRGQLVVHLDADIYSSTILVLLTLGPLLRTNDLLIFDELADSINEYRALEEFTRIFGFRYEVVAQRGGYMHAALKIIDDAAGAHPPVAKDNSAPPRTA